LRKQVREKDSKIGNLESDLKKINTYSIMQFDESQSLNPKPYAMTGNMGAIDSNNVSGLRKKDDSYMMDHSPSL
jgi:hypothetical protein